ncbi:MAG: hypothetical protein H6735_23050 [Alphaproteobacteria bacterium]|nr:hypothetical protein [Alphaproteobacteria bacterium]
MIALLRKELGAMLPWFLVGIALVGMSLLSVFWDDDPLIEDLGLRLSDGDGQTMIVWIFGFLVGQGAVAYEERDGHTEFLDGLPTRRSTVWIAKGIATVGAVVALVLGSFVSDVVLHTFTAAEGATSSLRPLMLEHLLMLVGGFGGLGAGLLLSWLGPLAYGVVGLALLIGFCGGLIWPPLRIWTPVVGTIGSLAWDHGSASHPWGPPLLQLATGGLMALGSFGLFLGPGRALVARGSQIVAVVRFGTVGCLSLLVGLLGALFALILVTEFGSLLLTGHDALHTEHFRILYAPADLERAQALAEEADELSERVAALVGDTDQGPLELDLELLGAPTNHLGVFTGGKIRLARDVGPDVLAHELTHAHARRLTGAAGMNQRAHVHFFEEGLANWVALRVVGGGPAVPVSAGALLATHQVRFDEIVDSGRHQAKHDITQSYLLGQVFVEALVQEDGEEAPGCFLRELGRVGDDPLPGLALWYGLAERCDVDLDAVQDRWLGLLEEARRELPALPRLRSRVTEDGALEVWDEHQLGYVLRCGFRAEPTEDVAHWVYLIADDGVCEVPSRVIQGRTFEAQVGYELPPTADQQGAVIFLPWIRLRAP